MSDSRINPPSAPVGQKQNESPEPGKSSVTRSDKSQQGSPCETLEATAKSIKEKLTKSLTGENQTRAIAEVDKLVQTFNHTPEIVPGDKRNQLNNWLKKFEDQSKT